MKNILLYIPLLLIVLLASACKKDDSAPNTSQKASLLLKSWKVSKVTDANQNIIIYQNPLPQGQVILEDYSPYRLTFSSNQYTLIDKGASSTSGQWELASNETKLIIDKGVVEKEIIMDLIELTPSSLKVNYVENSNKTGNRELLLELNPL